MGRQRAMVSGSLWRDQWTAESERVFEGGAGIHGPRNRSEYFKKDVGIHGPRVRSEF